MIAAAAGAAPLLGRVLGVRPPSPARIGPLLGAGSVALSGTSGGVAVLAAAAAGAGAVALLFPARSRAVHDRLGSTRGPATGAHPADLLRATDAADPVRRWFRDRDRVRPRVAGARPGRAVPVGTVLVAVTVAAVVAVALVAWHGSAAPADRLGVSTPAALLVAVLGAVVSPGVVGILPAAGVATAFALRARHRSRVAGAAVRTRRAVGEAVQVLASELRAGTPALEALRSASEVSPDLVAVAGTGLLGGDVAAALRRAGRRPGTGGLRYVAAAWTVSAEMGSALADTMDQLVELLRAEDLARDETASTLAAPRATARLLCVLPLAGLGLGASLGAQPWQTLTGTSWGPALTLVSVLLAGAGLEWVEHLAAAAEEPGGRSGRVRRSAGPRQAGQEGVARRWRPDGSGRRSGRRRSASSRPTRR